MYICVYTYLDLNRTTHMYALSFATCHVFSPPPVPFHVRRAMSPLLKSHCGLKAAIGFKGEGEG